MENRGSEIGLLSGILVSLLVFACSQKDPDEAGEPTPSWVWQCEEPGSSDAADGLSYFPMASSGTAQWSLHHFGGLEIDSLTDASVPDEDSWENITEVADPSFTSEIHPNDGTYYVFQDTPSQKLKKVTRDWLVERDGVVVRVHKEEHIEGNSSPILKVDYYEKDAGVCEQEINALEITYCENGFKRFDAKWLTKEPGWSEVVSYNRMVTLDTSGTGTEGEVGVPDDRTHRFTVMALSETVTVPAGTFENCLKMKRERIRAIASRGDVKFYWFCPGVGKVKEQEMENNPRTENLLYYCIPGGLCCS
ncbi:MAG: hypothetical protein GY854_28485 [Deltaproteobacteria bacterium]|nr:hypothetical protein [Deltaproteobacteria bacterium]